MDGRVGKGQQLAAAEPAERQRMCASHPGQFHCPQDVGGVAAAADADYQVARLDKVAQLLDHARLVALVVAPGHQSGRVVHQCLRAKAVPPGDVRSFVEVAGKVRRNGRAAAVAADIHPCPPPPGFHQQAGRGREFTGLNARDGCTDLLHVVTCPLFRCHILPFTTELVFAIVTLNGRRDSSLTMGAQLFPVRSTAAFLFAKWAA